MYFFRTITLIQILKTPPVLFQDFNTYTNMIDTTCTFSGLSNLYKHYRDHLYFFRTLTLIQTLYTPNVLFQNFNTYTNIIDTTCTFSGL